MRNRSRSLTALLVIVLALLPSGRLRAGEHKGTGMHPYPLWLSEPVPGWPGVDVDENTTPEKLAGKDKSGHAIWPATYGQPEFLAYQVSLLSAPQLTGTRAVSGFG